MRYRTAPIAYLSEHSLDQILGVDGEERHHEFVSLRPSIVDHDTTNLDVVLKTLDYHLSSECLGKRVAEAFCRRVNRQVRSPEDASAGAGDNDEAWLVLDKLEHQQARQMNGEAGVDVDLRVDGLTGGFCQRHEDGRGIDASDIVDQDGKATRKLLDFLSDDSFRMVV